MKKIKKFFLSVITILIAVVPLLLLGGGIYLSTGPFWDALMLVGIAALLVYDFKQYIAIKNGQESLESVRAMAAVIGTLLSVLALLAQAIFCHLHGAEFLLLEASVVWMFILISIDLISDLINGNIPDSVALKWSLILGTCWISICAIGGMLDFYEYFSGQEIPQRVGDIFGMLAIFSAIGCIVLMIVGIIQENVRK